VAKKQRGNALSDKFVGKLRESLSKGQRRSRRPVATRRRGRGAGGGNNIAFGILVDNVPANDWAADVAQIEHFGATGFTTELEDPEDPESDPVLIAVWNRSYKPLRGSTAFPVKISGPIYSWTYEDEEEVEHTTRILIYTPYDLAEESTFEESPANGKGQALFHPHGDRVQQVDGSPCGGEA
jgi:hypothetical protein